MEIGMRSLVEELAEAVTKYQEQTIIITGLIADVEKKIIAINIRLSENK